MIPEILASLRRHPNLIIEAEPGAGKTTRVPPALLAFGGHVIVLEPRRIAARMAARRVAREQGAEVGGLVGYQVRFEDSAGPDTRLFFVTEGILPRRMLSNPELRGVGAVVLDEFQERHIETDLALTLLRRLQATHRPDLRIVVMSATLDRAPVARFLNGAPVVRSEGRLFDLAIRHLPYSGVPLEKQVLDAVRAALPHPGDILVFLPGAPEIRRAGRACGSLAIRHGLLVAPLHGDLSPAEQDRAIEPAPERKLILSTNIAESSITVEGVSVVIDSGLARIAGDSPWTGLPTLEIRRISKAAARQRSGRAARTAPGLAIRLYPEEDFGRRPDYDTPEILRRELSRLCLHLEAAGIRSPSEVEWLDGPPENAVQNAESLLTRLGARGASARDFARIPLHPRLARLLLGGGDSGRKAAALLSSGQRTLSTDLQKAVDEPWDARTRASYAQLARYAVHDPADDHRLARAALAAFPDRVGKLRPNGAVLLSNGTAATMPAAGDSFGEFIVAIDAEERSDRGAPLIRLACAIEPDWLLDEAAERDTVAWNREAQRVEQISAIFYDQLVIDETREPCRDDEAAAGLLACRILESGLDRFVDRGELETLRARAAFAGLKTPEDSELMAAVTALCYGLRSLADFRKAAPGLIPLLESRIGPRDLEQNAPSRLRLPNGRSAKVHYEIGKPPWIASRLQDFFGMAETPRIGGGRVPVVVHLLAPNGRPVQTTADLTGFWARLYPQIRKELSRRYPRHAWPEDPGNPGAR